MKTIIESLRILSALTALMGIAYPLVLTGISRIAFHEAATGSVAKQGEKSVGSKLLAQKTESPKYFWPRPSSGDFATLASGASNKGPTSADLTKSIAKRREKLGKDAPDELLTASGSGLDPHLSPDAAKYQAARIAEVRKIDVAKVISLIERLTEGPQLGFLGEARVNVLGLNQALDELR